MPTVQETFKQTEDGRYVSGPDLPEPVKTKTHVPAKPLALLLGLLLLGAFVVLKPDTPQAPRETEVEQLSGDQNKGVARPMGQEGLDSLAQATAQMLASGDRTAAATAISFTEQLTGCDLQGFTGGPVIEGKPYLNDLSDPRAQAWVTKDATSRNWQIAFGHEGKTWLALAQNCGEGI